MNEDQNKTGSSPSETSKSTNSDAENIPSSSGNTDVTLGASAMFGSVPASPPSFVSLAQILKAAEDVSKSEFDMALVHEIAVNQNFQLPENAPKSSIEKKVTEICHKAFWDLLSEDLLESPPNYSQAMVLLKEIKETLLWLLLPHNARLKNEIEEVLDVDLVAQQARRGALDFSAYAAFIISTMARMCAPARDEKVQQLRTITEVVPLYKGILETLDLLKLDMVNFTISHLRPQLQRQSIEYERSKFKEILQSLEGLTPPVDGLRFTRLWLKDVYEEFNMDDTTENAKLVLTLRKAYLKILTWKESENFPETLHLDHARFINLRDALTSMTLTASVLLVTFSVVGPSIQGISDFKQELKSHVQILLADAPRLSQQDIEAKLEAVGLQVAKDVNACLENHGFSVLSKDKDKSLVDMLKKIAEEEHSVRQLMTKRILEFLDELLISPTALQLPPGLSILKVELSSMAGQFLSLVKHNQGVFGEYYNEILQSL